MCNEMQHASMRMPDDIGLMIQLSLLGSQMMQLMMRSWVIVV
jgi:hypothetical protein